MEGRSGVLVRGYDEDPWVFWSGFQSAGYYQPGGIHSLLQRAFYDVSGVLGLASEKDNVKMRHVVSNQALKVVRHRRAGRLKDGGMSAGRSRKSLVW